MEILKERNKRTGLIGTVSIHLLLLLVFAFFGMTYLEPPPEAEGISIVFGTSDVGSSSNETIESTEENVPTTQEEAQEPTETEKEILTQDIEDAPAVVKKDEKKEEQVVEEEKPKVNQKAMDAMQQWKSKKGEGSEGGDGETGEAGNQGSIDGDPNSKNYSGGGIGDGITYSLAGRSVVGKPTIKDDSQEEGKVVVDIIVDKQGKVIRATPGARGSTTASSLLYKKAKEAALQTRFSAKPNAAEEQKGQMTFIFILN